MKSQLTPPWSVRAMLAARTCLERVPYAVLALIIRAAIVAVFLDSALAHIADWNTTRYLFADEYKVPILAPDVAAYLAVGLELVAPVLLTLGLLSRLAAGALLCMTLVIEVFVYPQAWPTHIQWAAMLLVIVCRGPGLVSLDEAFYRWVKRSPASRGVDEARI
jgi:putative oxidoreductase